MTKSVTLKGLSSVSTERELDLVRIDGSGDGDQEPAIVDIHRGLLGPLIASLKQAARAFPPAREADAVLSQPMQLQGAEIIALEDGSLGLQLALDDGLRLAVIIPFGEIAPLKECLEAIAALSDLSTADISGSTVH
jgi:hypothetical protein